MRFVVTTLLLYVEFQPFLRFYDLYFLLPTPPSTAGVSTLLEILQGKEGNEIQSVLKAT